MGSSVPGSVGLSGSVSSVLPDILQDNMLFLIWLLLPTPSARKPNVTFSSILMF